MDSSVRLVPGIDINNYCEDCYFFGFADDMPEEWHTCPGCRQKNLLPTIPVSFDMWRLRTCRYIGRTFEQFQDELKSLRDDLYDEYPDFRLEREEWNEEWEYDGLREEIMAVLHPMLATDYALIR